MKISFRLAILSFSLLLLAACNPLEVKQTLNCDKKSHICTITISNLENREVGYSLDIGYEPQGTPMRRVNSPLVKTEERFDHWERQINFFFHIDGIIPARDTITITTTLPKDFFETPGQSLVDAYLWTESPNIFSAAYGKYHTYTVIKVPGYYPRPIKYIVSCSEETAKITVTNTGEWGDRNIALYLNGNLDQVWQSFTVKAGETMTFTTDPVPSGTYLIEADVHGHQEQTYMDRLDYHGSRAYCVPNQ